MTKQLQLFFVTTATMLFIQSCSNNSHNSTDDNFLITNKSIGLAKLGQTIDDLKQEYNGCSFTTEPVGFYGVDGEGTGIKVSKDNEDLIYVWTQNESDKIHCIIALNKKYHTSDGIKPTITTSGELKRLYPQMKINLDEENAELEYFFDNSILYVFKQTDSTYVGHYKDDTTSDIYDTTKVITRIEIMNRNGE